MINTLTSHSRALSPQLDMQTDMVLRLLSQVILADGHVLSSEIEALIRGTRELNLKDKFGTALTEADIRDWFAAYQLTSKTEKSPLRPDVALTHLILKLSDWPEKQAVVNVLTDISLSDADFHLKEKTLISIVKAFWQFEGLEVSDAKIES